MSMLKKQNKELSMQYRVIYLTKDQASNGCINVDHNKKYGFSVFQHQTKNFRRWWLFISMYKIVYIYIFSHPQVCWIFENPSI